MPLYHNRFNTQKTIGEAMITYEQRVSKIKTIEDIDDQLRKAKAYARRLRSAAVACPTLADKLAMNEKVKEAERVLRTLRMNSFDIEDSLKLQGAA